MSKKEEEIIDKKENKEEENLKEAIKKAKEKAKQPIEPINYKEKYIRAIAELENSRKRMQKEKETNIKFAIENIICEFLPAMDNLENALKFSKDSSDEVKKWASGFQMIHSQLRDILHNHGIVAFHSKGNVFDPNFHEAMEIVETSEHPEDTILEEFAKGYKSEKRTIRPAKVKVAKKLTKKEQK